MSVRREERSYAEVLTVMWGNDTLVNFMKTPNMTTGSGVNKKAIADYLDLAVNSRGMLNIEGWWYLCFRTCDGIGAKLVVEYFAECWMKDETTSPPTDWPAAKKKKYWDDIKNIDPDREKQLEELRDKFQEYMQSKANWWESSYAKVAAAGIGPWPKDDDI